MLYDRYNRGYVRAAERMKESKKEFLEAVKAVFSRVPDNIRKFRVPSMPTRIKAIREAGRSLGNFLYAAEDWVFEKCGLTGDDTILRFQRSYQREVAKKMEASRKEESRFFTASGAERSAQKETVRFVDLDSQKAGKKERVGRELAEKIKNRNQERGIER